MEKKSLIQKCAGLPVPLLPAMVGAVTLSNVYGGTLGYSWLRHISTIAAMIVWIFALIKICAHSGVFTNEYKNTVPASLYACFAMLMMLFGAYTLPYSPVIGKGLWFAGVILQAAHILIFTYNNVVKGVKAETFVPSWFVTYNGIMVSTVVGGSMNEPLISKIILYYGLIVYPVLLVCLIFRISTKPLNPALLHTKAIFLAPACLCLVSYLNVAENPNGMLVNILYAAVFLSFVYFLINIPKFFSVPFAPGFAGLTFPNAIGVVASLRMSGWLESAGNSVLSQIVKEIAGIQLYITTAVIVFVIYNFLKMFAKSYEKKEVAV